MQLTITGYSTALFSTWYFVEEPGLLFDAGDGIVTHLLQKSRKVKHVFLSHADRDHLTGLLQLNQLNARPGFPKLFYPKDARSIHALEMFSKQFDRQVNQTEWVPLQPGEEVEVSKNLVVVAVRNSHVAAPGEVSKSFGYLLQYKKQKLKPEYLGLSQRELIGLKQRMGEHELTVEVRDNLLAYSGDTPVENFQLWHNTNVLIHEATFIDRSDISPDPTAHNKHSLLEDVIVAASQVNIKHLVLGHFSSRYTAAEIRDCIVALCTRHRAACCVYTVLPGETVHNILNHPPVYNAVC